MSNEGFSLRCSACNASMNGSPLWFKDSEGNKHFNDLCSRCTFISKYPEYAEVPEHEQGLVLMDILGIDFVK